MTKADAYDTASIHCEALADDFLPSLGGSFMTTLYKCIIGTDAGFGVVYSVDGNIVGAAMATENSKLFYRTLLLKRFWAMIPKLCLSLVKNPALIKRTFETLLYSGQESGEAEPEAELIAIVLRNGFQRRGIGSKILRFLNAEFVRRGIKSYVVKTYADNKASNGFYISHGFVKRNSFVMYGRKWNIYQLKTHEHPA